MALVLICMVLFNDVLSCIMLLVPKMHKNLSHHESTIMICDTKLLRYVMGNYRYYIVFDIVR